MKDRSSTGVVITQWRDPETTAVCLGHVASLKSQPRMVVVVDNESESSVLAGQSAQFPHVRFLALSTNTGHANAVNIGVRHVYDGGCEYALLLDNDAYVTPECLEILEGALDSQPAAAAASPLILSGRRPGLIWYGGGRISFLGNSIHEDMWGSENRVDRSMRQVGYVTSCALLVRASAFVDAGGFDASLHAYTDDLDFCMRMNNAGKSLLFVPAAEATHGESVNVIRVAGKEFRDYYTMRNRLIAIRKNGTLMQKGLGIPLGIFWHGVVYGVGFLVRGEWRRTAALFRGVADFVSGHTGTKDV